jgi:hypothetical protein
LLGITHARKTRQQAGVWRQNHRAGGYRAGPRAASGLIQSGQKSQSVLPQFGFRA